MNGVRATTRVATYNLWNSTVSWQQRLAAIVDELHALGADVVALQEAPTEASPGCSLAAYLEAETGYRHVLHLPYDVEPDEGDRPEGLALLANRPWRDVWINWNGGARSRNNWAAKAHIEIAGRRLASPMSTLIGRSKTRAFMASPRSSTV